MTQLTDSGSRNRERGDLTPGYNPVTRQQRIFRVVLWILGVVVLAVLGYIVHTHKAPYPFELTATKDIQGPHPVPCLALQQPRSPLEAALFDVSQLNNPIPSVIGGAIWLVGMLILRLWRQALTLVTAVLSVGGLFLVLTPLVARPRPTIASGICVHDHYAYFSFPSGHVSHDVVTYGFLLYVTLSEPVRSWRYRWLLIPLQLLFVFDLLTIGYSRLLEGDHWLLDVTGGYIVGILWLTLFIFLYRRFVSHWGRHHHIRQGERAAHV
jgi:membrane-associated phospholipid phosphatase